LIVFGYVYFLKNFFFFLFVYSNVLQVNGVHRVLGFQTTLRIIFLRTKI